MKTRYTFLISILSICTFLLCGCQEDEWGSQGASKRLTSIYATTSEVVKTRALLTEGNAVVWEEGDEIGVFSDQTKELTSFICNRATDEGGDFDADDALMGTTFYAIYPYENNSGIEVIDDKKIAYELSSMQSYREGSFDPENCPMVATSTTDQFRFLQTCGIIRIKLKTSSPITYLNLASNDGTPIAGEGTIDFNSESPIFKLDENALYNTISIINLPKIGGEGEEEVSFYFVLPEMTLSHGFNLQVFYEGGSEFVVKQTNKPVKISRAVITTFSTDPKGELEQEKTEERDALVALYEATNGDNWKNNANWCTDAPLEEWYGVTTDELGKVRRLELPQNNLTGNIPTEIGCFSELYSLDLSNNALNGEIPNEIGNLTSLGYLYLSSNSLEGSIPPSIGNLYRLKSLYLSHNKLTGTFPLEMSQLTELSSISLDFNNFSGELSVQLTSTDWWQKFGWNFLDSQRGFNFDIDSYNLHIPDFTFWDHKGNSMNSSNFIANHEYSIYFNFGQYTDKLMLKNVCDLLDTYSSLGVGAFGFGGVFMSNSQYYIDGFDVEWPVIMDDGLFDVWDGCVNANRIYLFDKTGKLICQSSQNDDAIKEILRVRLGEGFVYESTDYSVDGKVHVLQRASATGANGINVVFMGDGFSDRQIANGLYADLMQQGMKAFFLLEPYASFKDLFNIYYVDAVSKNEGLADGHETVFNSRLGEGTHIGGDNEKCMSYAQRCGFTDEEMNELLVVVIVNSLEDHGTAYNQLSSEYTGDYGRGSSVTYSTMDLPKMIRVGTVIHECGHGFAKLADEYTDSEEGHDRIPTEQVEDLLNRRNIWGCGKNIDFTNDTSKAYWSKFINDPRYADEGIGLFEGGALYKKGVWRPTENSVMRQSSAEIGFNAPSREAIYYRIHKLAYGEDWEYDYEEFVQWDLLRPRTHTRTISFTEEVMPTTPPVVTKARWENGRFVYE